MYRMFGEDGRFKAYPPSGNFMLVRLLGEGMDSGEMFERAIREGMMIRDCSTFPFLDHRYVRFCFMGREMDDRLAECLMR